MGHLPTKASEFHRRHLSIAKKPSLVEMMVFVDGNQMVAVNSKKASLMAFVSRPEDDGFNVEIVEDGMAPFTDISRPEDEPETPRRWQLDATGKEKASISRRVYTIEGDALDEAKSIEVRFRIDGELYLVMPAREPGYMGYVLHKRGFDIDVVGPKEATYLDRRGPGMESYDLYPWQVEAVGLKPE